MSDTIIRVERLTKEYVLGSGGSQDGLRHMIHDFVMAPLRRLRNGADHLHRAAGKNGTSNGKSFLALNDVSFDVKQGEVIGIIGRNGAGKSTLLKILSRITEPTSGRVEIKGRVASLLEVGTGFHPELTGRENIFLNGSILGMARAEIKKKFDEIVAFAEVEKFLDTPVKRYSSGMYVRLAFAVAAHLEPEILIIDEVLAVGDAQFQKKCLGKMQDVAGQGRTVLFVSHNLSAVMSLTTRCVYLKNGAVSFIGTTREAIEKYTGCDEDNNLIFLDKKAGTGGEPGIRSVEVNTSFPGNVHVNNSPLEILIKINTPRPIKGACLTVQIFDSEQVNYANIWTQDLDVPMCRQPGIHLLKCVIPQCRLYMGDYRLRVFLSEPPGGKSFQTLDGICPFKVVMRDNVRLFPWNPKECAYVENYRWESQLVENE